jgi:hypothetical protein
MLLTVWPVISITVRLSEVVVTTAPVLHAFLVFIVRDFMHSAKEDTWDSGRIVQFSSECSDVIRWYSQFLGGKIDYSWNLMCSLVAVLGM